MAEYTIDKFSYGGNTYKLQDNVSGYITVNDIPKEIYTVKIGGTVNWSEVKQAYEEGKVIIGVWDDSGDSDGLGQYSILSEIYYDKNSAYGTGDYMVFATLPPFIDDGAIDTWIVFQRWVPDNGGTWEEYDRQIVSEVRINGSSITEWGGVANIVTNTAYNSSSNKIATMTDITNAVPNNSNWVNGSATGSVRTINASLTIGTGAVAEGVDSEASGDYSHAEGYSTASGDFSHSEGEETEANAEAAHAEGYLTEASGVASHAEGDGTVANGYGSHTEGSNTNASGIDAHAEGGSTTASGSYAHAEGSNTTANHKSQHVFGEYNVLDTSTDPSTARGTYVEIVGKGTSNNARSNARTLDWNGNETLAGKLTLGAAPTANMDAATKQYVDNAMTVVTFTPDGVNNNLIISIQNPSSIQNGNEVNY